MAVEIHDPVRALAEPTCGAYLVTSELSKRYGETTALDHLSLTIRRGEVYGLLGPNGAGKSTLIDILCTVVRPTSGRIIVAGRDLLTDAGVRRQIGVVPQDLAVYGYLTGEENVRFFGRLHGLRGKELADRCEAALRLTGLFNRRREVVNTYSGGMKRRLNFAVGVVAEPRLLLLDEPMVNVDPQSRDCLAEGIRELCRRGTTVVYTTHQLEEAEDLCDRVGILDRGRLIAEGKVAELAAKVEVGLEAGSPSPGLRQVFIGLTGSNLRD